MKKISFLFFLSIVLSVSLYAQQPASWTTKFVDKGNGEVELTTTFRIDPTWHIFDITIPENGPMPTTISIDKLKGATKVGNLKAVNSKLKKKYDDIFQMEYGYYENQATFVQTLKITEKAAFALEGDFRGQVCSEIDGQCIPIKIDLDFKSKDLPATVVAAKAGESDSASEGLLAEQVQADSLSSSVSSTTANVSSEELWTPVIGQLKAYGAAGDTSDMSLLWIFLGGFGGGLIALLTPCV